MWFWMGPTWMRPGSRFSRVMWIVSLPVAAVLIWFAWTRTVGRPHGTGLAFLLVWTVAVVAIEAWNFRTMFLGRGRRAEAMQRAMDERTSR
jgi:hypothetical protein